MHEVTKILGLAIALALLVPATAAASATPADAWDRGTAPTDDEHLCIAIPLPDDPEYTDLPRHVGFCIDQLVPYDIPPAIDVP